MAFFNNAQNFRADREVTINYLPGDQYNDYNAGGRRHDPHPAPAEPRGSRRSRRQHQNHRRSPSRNLDFRGATFTIIQGRQFVNGRRVPVNESQNFQEVADADGENIDIEMSSTVPQSEPSATSADDHPPAFAYTYVVVQLDKEATIQSLQQHPTVIPAVRNMPVESFVGYVEPVAESDSEFLIHLLRNGPLNLPAQHITPQMCVPVLPNSGVDPESSREPLRPDRELPWADCYHSPSDHLVVRIPPQAVDSKPNTIITSLPSEEVIRHSNYITDDYRRRSRVARRRSKEVKIAKKELHDLISGTRANVTLDDAAVSQAELNVSRATESAKALRKSLAIQMNALQTAIMTVRISHDLSLITELPNPQELLNQQIYLADRLKNKPSE